MRSVSYALLRCGVPRAEVEDAIQEVFVILHSRFDTVDAHERLGPWLREVARRVAQNRIRSSQRRRLESLPAEPDQAGTALTSGHEHLSPEERLLQRERWERLMGLLDDLDPSVREVWLDKVVHGRTAMEIGKATTTPSNTVFARLRTARAHLARVLGHVDRF